MHSTATVSSRDYLVIKLSMYSNSSMAHLSDYVNCVNVQQLQHLTSYLSLCMDLASPDTAH